MTILSSKYSSSFLFYSYGHHRDLHSFPTRRSSDLHSRSSGPLAASKILTLWPHGICATTCCTELRSEEHTSELQSQSNLVCRLLLEKKKPPERGARWRPCRRSNRRVHTVAEGCG